MVASAFLSAMVLASCAASTLARPADCSSGKGKTVEARAVAAQPALEPRWVALGDDYVLPGSLKKPSGSKKIKRDVAQETEELRKRAAVAEALAILGAEETMEEQHLERRQQVCSVVTVTRAPRPAASTTTTSKAATSTARATCKVTADCVEQVIPDFANHYCVQSTGSCGFRCYSGYSLVSGKCVRAGATTTNVPTTTVRPQTATSRAEVITTARTTTTTRATNAVASPTSTTSTGPSTFWSQKSIFGSLASFTEDVVQNSRFVWGKTNTVVVQGVPASGWKNKKQLDTSSAIQVAYPAGSRNPSSLPIGGVGFYSAELDITAASNVSLSYSVFFPEGFNFVKGGKLPGLYGGSTACSGGSAAESCFSTRLMFRTGGTGELYLYAPREKQVDALCTLGPLSFCNSVYGMSIGRGSWTFATGEWTDIRQDIWLNTPGKADGGFNIWVNDKLALTSSSVYYRNSAVGNVFNGTETRNITLINYDDLPEGTDIPNGGFPTAPVGSTAAPTFSLPLVTKVLQPASTASAHDSTRGPRQPLPTDYYNRRNVIPLSPAEEEPKLIIAEGGKRRRSLLLASEASEERRAEKRATSTVLPTGFKGIMFNTFFGGSDASWNSPKLQYSYFKGIGLRTN